MTIHLIIKGWLKDNGYDGLFSDDYGCACLNRDLMPCDEPGRFCEPGYMYKIKCKCIQNMDYDWYVSKTGRCPDCGAGLREK